MVFSLPGVFGGQSQSNSMGDITEQWTRVKAAMDAMGIDNLIQNQSQNVIQGPMAAANMKSPQGMSGAPVPSMLGGMGQVAGAGQRPPGQMAQSMWGLMSSPSSPFYGGGGAV